MSAATAAVAADGAFALDVPDGVAAVHLCLWPDAGAPYPWLLRALPWPVPSMDLAVTVTAGTTVDLLATTLRTGTEPPTSAGAPNLVAAPVLALVFGSHLAQAQSAEPIRIGFGMALTGPLAAARYDWYTNYGDFGSTNANAQELKSPLRMRWARRLEGTIKHLPVCGGGRLYTHTAEGQIIAVEQDTGRLLWRRYWPDVYLSFTSPLYHDGKLLVPQAGMKRSLIRCLDAATGELLWEAPFSGSPSWSRRASSS